MLLQVAFPFSGWQDPSNSLERRGWSVGQESIETASSNPEWPIYQAELENDLGGRVYLFSSFIDRDFQPFAEFPGVDDSETAAQQNFLDILRGRRRHADQLTMQIRLICESGEPLTRVELQTLQSRFEQLRQIFIQAQELPRPVSDVSSPLEAE